MNYVQEIFEDLGFDLEEDNKASEAADKIYEEIKTLRSLLKSLPGKEMIEAQDQIAKEQFGIEWIQIPAAQWEENGSKIAEVLAHRYYQLKTKNDKNYGR